LVDAPPQVVVFAIAPQKYLIQMPCVTSPWAAATQLIRVLWPKLLAPLTDCFGRDDDSTREQEFFNISITQTKTEVQPDTTADDLRWAAVVPITVR
jgi:hypothetical protein